MKKIFRLLLLGFLTVTVLFPSFVTAETVIGSQKNLPISTENAYLLKRETIVTISQDETVEFKYKAKTSPNAELFVQTHFVHTGHPVYTSVKELYAFLTFPDRTDEPINISISQNIGGTALNRNLKFDSRDGLQPNENGWITYRFVGKDTGAQTYHMDVQLSHERLPFAF